MMEGQARSSVRYQAMSALAAAHGLVSSGPLVHTGGGGWHYYLAPTGLGNVSPAGLAHVDWRGRGGYVVAPPSRHASGQAYQWAPGRDLLLPPGPVPAVLWERLQPRQRHRPTARVELAAGADGPAEHYARAARPPSWPGSPPPPSASATPSCGNQPATSTTWSPPAPCPNRPSSTGSSRPPNAAACSPRSRARPTAPWPPAARSASPTPATHPNTPPPTAPMHRRPHPRGVSASQLGTGGEADGRQRPVLIHKGWVRAAAKQSPHPPRSTPRKDPVWAATQP
jgi:Bifunctional DNA primase/polymerase, N-terminal